MSQPITVKDLSGHHLGKRITITTENTTAEGVLQGFQHQANVVNMTNMARPDWVILGQRSTTITLMPNQDVIAELGDVVVVHDDEPRICDNRNAGPLPPIGNAGHQAEMNGEKL